MSKWSHPKRQPPSPPRQTSSLAIFPLDLRVPSPAAVPSTGSCRLPLAKGDRTPRGRGLLKTIFPCAGPWVNLFPCWSVNWFAILMFYCCCFTCWVFTVPRGKFRSPYLGKTQQLQKQRYPILSVCTVFLCGQTMVWLPVFAIFNVRTDADAHGGFIDPIREPALEADSWRNIPCPTGIPKPASAFQSDAPPEILQQVV